MGHVASSLIPGVRLACGYADLLLKGIQPADFARTIPNVRANHPAFCYGHLSLYPDRLLTLMGREDLTNPDAAFESLFGAGKEALDDPAGTIYPPMHVIVDRFRERHEVVLQALAEVTDEAFAQPNPNERGRERFPTLGAVAFFYLGGHLMSHLGQVSTWRRVMGLAPAME